MKAVATVAEEDIHDTAKDLSRKARLVSGFVVLGSPNSLSGMSADELAAKIASSSGGQNIRLLSCQTGCPTGSFAQDLSNRLGVRVMAPTTDIGASGSGKTLDMYGGQWRWFDPN